MMGVLARRVDPGVLGVDEASGLRVRVALPGLLQIPDRRLGGQVVDAPSYEATWTSRSRSAWGILSCSKSLLREHGDLPVLAHEAFGFLRVRCSIPATPGANEKEWVVALLLLLNCKSVFNPGTQFRLSGKIPPAGLPGPGGMMADNGSTQFSQTLKRLRLQLW